MTETAKKPKRYNYSDKFEQFWKAYPSTRKTDKPGAFKLWQKDNLEAIADEIIADVEVRAQYDKQWLAGYSKAPTPYLRSQGWDGDSWEDTRKRGPGPSAPKGEKVDLGPPPQPDPYKAAINTFLFKELLRIGGKMSDADLRNVVLRRRDEFAKQLAASYPAESLAKMRNRQDPECVTLREEYEEVVAAWKRDTSALIDRIRRGEAGEVFSG